MFEMPDAAPTWSAETAEVEAEDAGPLANPSAISRAGPNLTASGVIAGVTRIITAAAGSVASPASSALYANAAGSWKYRLSTCLLYTSDAADERSSVDLG